MTFKDNQPIFIQIAERLSDEILSGTYVPDGRVPGVREYAALLEVNPNTAVKSYDWLAQRGILYTKRGLGYFVAPEAEAVILDNRRKVFFDTDLPEFVSRMRQLGIAPEEFLRAYEENGNNS